MKRTLSEDAWLASIGKHRGVAIRIHKPQNMIKAMTHFVMAYFVWSESISKQGDYFAI